MGALIAGFGVFIVVGLYMPIVGLRRRLLRHRHRACRRRRSSSSCRSRRRSSRTACARAASPWSGMYIFLFGGFFGAVLTGMLTDALGRRGALTLIVLPVDAHRWGAHRLRRPLHQGRHLPLRRGAARGEGRRPTGCGRTDAASRRSRSATSTSPMARCRSSSTSTSTCRRARRWRSSARTAPASRRSLRVISGLGVASRGVVRLHGRTITYADPELRAKIGIVQLHGGQRRLRRRCRWRRTCAWRASSTTTPSSSAAIDAVLERFPELRRAPAIGGRATCPAGSSRCWRWPWRCCTSPTCSSSTSSRSAWRP